MLIRIDYEKIRTLIGLVIFSIAAPVNMAALFILEKHWLKHYPWYRPFDLLCLGHVIFLGLPIIFYIKYYERENVISFLKLNRFTITGIILVIAVSFLHFLSLLPYIDQPVKFNLHFSVKLWASLITAAFWEEVVFRGVILQKAKVLMPFWLANIVTALWFTLLHSTGDIYFSFTIRYIVSSLIYGYVFYKADLLWPCIFIHLIHNVLVLSLKLHW